MKVLIADDDPDDLVMIERCLLWVDSSLDVKTFDSAHSLLQYLDKPSDSSVSADEAREVVVLDLNMPGIDGIMALKSLRARQRNRYTPALIYTTSKSHYDIRDAYAAGASGCLCKGSTLEEMRAQFKSIVDYFKRIEPVPGMILEGS